MMSLYWKVFNRHISEIVYIPLDHHYLAFTSWSKSRSRRITMYLKNIIMKNIIMKNIIMKNIIMKNIIMKNIIMKNLIMKNIILKNIIMNNMIMKNIIMKNIIMKNIQKKQIENLLYTVQLWVTLTPFSNDPSHSLPVKPKQKSTLILLSNYKSQ